MTVRLEHLTVRYGSHLAVDDLSAEFARGAVALLGRNGAGKSSVLRVLLGLVRPERGIVRFVDLPAAAPLWMVRRHVGYMPERTAHVPGATGFEQVSLLGAISGLSRRDAWRRAHEVLHLVGLGEERYRPMAGYSTGMRQKVKLAGALVHDPGVLFLDEPTNGLDPVGRDEMLRLVGQLAADFGKSIVFSTHILSDVTSVCRAAIVMERGRVVAHGTLEELTSGEDRRFELFVEGADDSLGARLQDVGQIVASANGRFVLQLHGAAVTKEMFSAVVAAGGHITSLGRLRRTLEEVFVRAVSPEPLR